MDDLRRWSLLISSVILYPTQVLCLYSRLYSYWSPVASSSIYSTDSTAVNYWIQYQSYTCAVMKKYKTNYNSSTYKTITLFDGFSLMLKTLWRKAFTKNCDRLFCKQPKKSCIWLEETQIEYQLDEAAAAAGCGQ